METDILKKANDFLEATNATLKIVFYKYDYHFINDKQRRNIYKCILERNKKQYTFYFGDSIRNTIKNTKPNKYDILTCLTTSDPEDFEYFCDVYHYNKYNDLGRIDKQSLEIYKAVKREYDNLCSLFSYDEIELLSQIE